MAAVHAAIRLVSPIETTIHSGEIILLLPGKSGTINAFFNSEMWEAEKTKAGSFKSFFESFGDEFIGQEDFVKPVLIRTGAHFRFPGDKQFVTVVYSGSGRMVFNFDSDSHTNPMQKLYFEDRPGGFVVTNKAQNGKENNFHFGYSLFDIPACTSEIQTDILVDLSLVTPQTTTGPTSKTSTPKPATEPTLTEKEIKDYTKFFIEESNYHRKQNPATQDDNARKEEIYKTIRGHYAPRDYDEKEKNYEKLYKDLYAQLDFSKDGYYAAKNDTIEFISIDKYKQKLKEIRDLTPKKLVSRLGKYFNKEQIQTIGKVRPGKILLAQMELGLPEKCIPNEDSFWNSSSSPNQESSLLKSKIDACDQMRVSQDGNKS